MITLTILVSFIGIITFTGLFVLSLKSDLARLTKNALAFYFMIILILMIAGLGICLARNIRITEFFSNIYLVTANTLGYAFLPLSLSINKDKYTVPVTGIAHSALIPNILIIMFKNSISESYIGGGAYYVPVLNTKLLYLTIPSSIFFIAGVIYSIAAIKKQKSGLIKQRLYYILTASLIIFLGLLTNFTFLVEYPADLLIALLGGFLLSYAVIQKQLLNIKKVFYRGTFRLLMLSSMTGIYILLLFLLQIIVGIPIAYWTIIPAFITFLIISIYISKSKLYTVQGRSVYEDSLQQYRMLTADLYDPSLILETLTDIVSSELKIDSLHMFIKDNSSGCLIPVLAHSDVHKLDQQITAENTATLIEIIENKNIIVTDELSHTISEKLRKCLNFHLPDIVLPVRIIEDTVCIIYVKLAKAFIDKEERTFLLALNQLTTEAVIRSIAHEQLKMEVSSRDNLIKDINHRVKNNLQMIAGLLSLQGMSTDNDDVKDALNTAKQRIAIIAQVHEMLYIKGIVETVNLKEYIEAIIRGFSSIQHDDTLIQYQLDFPEIIVETEKALTICLILNELISNAVKYAFPDKRGIITIKAERKDDNNLLCVIADNGVGYCSDKTRLDGIGHSLVHNFITKQLKGRWEINSDAGTEHILHIPLAPPA